MSNNKEDVRTYLDSVEKKQNNAKMMREGALIFTGITGAMAITAGIMGGASYVTADMSRHYLEKDVSRRQGYVTTVENKEKQLLADFTEGKISYEDYKAGCDALYSTEDKLDYVKNSDDEMLKYKYESYERDKKMSDDLLKKGVPSILAMAGAGAVGYGITDMIRRKYDRMIEDYKLTHDEVEMAD